ncbi:hypothetical protein BC835DRAFT_952200 [Cytidiella melzeri]|nr:hypothetical protein BC835DRAFT_952200 [Cytidiella melzeri]
MYAACRSVLVDGMRGSGVALACTAARCERSMSICFHTASALLLSRLFKTRSLKKCGGSYLHGWQLSNTSDGKTVSCPRARLVRKKTDCNEMYTLTMFSPMVSLPDFFVLLPSLECFLPTLPAPPLPGLLPHLFLPPSHRHTYLSIKSLPLSVERSLHNSSLSSHFPLRLRLPSSVLSESPHPLIH